MHQQRKSNLPLTNTVIKRKEGGPVGPGLVSVGGPKVPGHKPMSSSMRHNVASPMAKPKGSTGPVFNNKKK